MSITYTVQELEALRDARYHRAPGLRVRTEDQALAFVNEVGYCYLFGDKDVEIPTLFGAIAGNRAIMEHSHHDPAVGLAWGWKDSLPARGAILYAKLLRGKPTLVSLDLVPCFYALTPNYGDEDDYLLQYEEGRLSVEARNVYEALLNEGALSTSRLRQVAGISGGGANARRFDRAIAELQSELKIAKVGISDANRWGYAYVYDLFSRRFPAVPEAARAISTDRAMATLLERYLASVVAIGEGAARRLFRWDAWEWERTLARMREAGRLAEDVHIDGLAEDCLALTAQP